MVVLVRATASLRLLEEALEEQGLPTYVVGGRGYWSQEQVRDGLAWLRVLANPHDEEALLTVLASPFHGADTDELVRLTQDGHARGSLWEAVQASDSRVARLLAAEREHAQRAPLEVLLERAIVATGYDLATLARPGGDRRLANLRKLMRLAGEYERAEGRDLRGFLADAQARDLAEAREGEAALESEGLDAVRLMTIHRAKGLEFPVVCVADLGRKAGGTRSPLLVGDDGTAGLRLAPLGGGDTIPTTTWTDARRRGRRGRRRGGAPPLLRRDDPRQGAADPLRRHRHLPLAVPPPGRPADRLDRPRRRGPARSGLRPRRGGRDGAAHAAASARRAHAAARGAARRARPRRCGAAASGAAGAAGGRGVAAATRASARRARRRSGRCAGGRRARHARLGRAPGAGRGAAQHARDVRHGPLRARARVASARPRRQADDRAARQARVRPARDDACPAGARSGSATRS